MNQQEFDAKCIEMNAELRRIVSRIKNDRLLAQHRLRQEMSRLDTEKNAVVSEYRDALYDLATSLSPRSADFVAGQARARNDRDSKLAAIDARRFKLEADFFEHSQKLSRDIGNVKYEFSVAKAELVKEYNEWLAQHKAEKAEMARRQEGGVEA